MYMQPRQTAFPTWRESVKARARRRAVLPVHVGVGRVTRRQVFVRAGAYAIAGTRAAGI